MALFGNAPTVDLAAAQQDYARLLGQNEQVHAAYQLIRDTILFTDRRLLLIDGTAFAPATVTVQQGDRVVWQNKDPFPHTATSPAGGFDSKSIAPGKSWTFVAARKGTFEYVCSFHPTMKGTLVVQ
jgi:hypothetical protein